MFRLLLGLWYSLPISSSAALLLLTSSPLLAQSITPADDGTGTQIIQQGDRYTITGGSRSGDGANLFHSFDDFGLDTDEIATFLSQPDIENILGRVTGGDASIIDGLLQVTGGSSNLYLINPAGILFGPNARLDLPASFFATTATGIGFGDRWLNAIGPSDYTNLIGNPDSFAFTLAQPGAIANLGDLSVNPGETLSLIGGTVLNVGTLSAPGGTITVASVPGANRVRLSQEGSLLSLELEAANGNWESGLNPIPFSPLSLPDLLTGGDLTSANQVSVNADGTIQLAGATIPLEGATTIVSGTLDTANPTPNGATPEINVLGDRTLLLNASLNASAINGGGTVRIGGDYQGQGSVFNGRRTFIDSASTITADALTTGNGGRVLIWADEITHFAGTLSAQGGIQSGDGGFAEVSGQQTLSFTGTVDLSAPFGDFGTLLLDPTDIVIQDGAGIGTDDASLPEILAGEPGAPFIVFEQTLEGLLGSANVILEATNDITLNDLTDNFLVFTLGTGSITFTADADNDGAGDFTMNSGDSININGRDITISGANLVIGTISTLSNNAPSGSITLTADNTLTTGNLFTSASGPSGESGDISLTSQNGAIDTTGGVLNTSSISGTAGAITLSAAGDITTGQDTSFYGLGLDASSQSGTGGTITITSIDGSINTSLSTLDVSSLSGNAGTIELAAEGDVTTGGSSLSPSIGLDASSIIGNGGTIAISSTSGTIDTTAGALDVSSISGDAGEISLTADSTITTGNVYAHIVSTYATPAPGEGGTITITSQTGGIDTSAGQLLASAVSGNAGTVTLSADGAITTGSIRADSSSSSFGSSYSPGDGGTITITSNSGTIDTSNGALDVSSTLGNAGTVILTADSDITTNNIDASIDGSNPGTGDGGAITIVSETGAINTTEGTLNASSIDGNGGTIALTASGNVTTDRINARSNTGAGGEITIISTEGNIDTTAGPLIVSSDFGNAGAIALTANDTLSVNRIVADSFTGSGGEITLTSETGAIQAADGEFSTVSFQANGGGITLSAATNINLGELTFGSFVSSSSSNPFTANTPGLITFSSTILEPNGAAINLGNLTALSAVNFPDGFVLNTNGGNFSLTVRENLRWSNAINTNGGTVSLTSQDDLTVTAPITTLGGTISLESRQGGINTSNSTLNSSSSTGGGNITLQAVNTILTGTIAANATETGRGGDITILSEEGEISANDPLSAFSNTGNGGTIRLEALNAITAGPIFSGSRLGNGGNIILISENGTINTNTGSLTESELEGLFGSEIEVDLTGVSELTGLLSGSTAGNGGDIRLRAAGNITTGNLNAAVAEGNGQAGSITVVSLDGDIDTTAAQNFGLTLTDTATGDTRSPSFSGVDTSAVDGTGGLIEFTANNGSVFAQGLRSSGATGGNIVIRAATEIRTGTINTRGRIGNGGNVLLDPSGDVEVVSINAEGGNEGTGGTVTIRAGQSFRATGSFTNRNGLQASISTAGGAGSGAITIRHGGNGDPAFVVGRDFGENGSLAAITSGDFTIRPGESFVGSAIRGNIQILTDFREPSPPSDSIPDECSIDCTNTPDNPSPTSSETQALTIPALPLAQTKLLNLIDQTGVKPAILYVSFVSTEVPITNDVAQREAIASQQIATYLNQENPTEAPLLSAEPQDSDELELLLVLPEGDTIRHRVTGVTRAMVMQTRNDLLREITNLARLRLNRYQSPAQQLHEWLITPIEAKLVEEEIHNLAFIMDAGLRMVPMAALFDGEQFLIEKYSIGLMPSLSLTDPRYVDLRDLPVLAMGASEFDALPALPAVPAELRTITKLVDNSIFFLNEDFTQANLLQERREQPFSIVHLATHADFRGATLENSYIQFGDRPLPLDQIRELGLSNPPIELLVLSACRTALGNDEAELGFGGLAVQAGVRSVLASLWYVSDTGTLSFMSEFYHNLREAPIRAEAVRQTQIAMLRGDVQLQDGRLLIPGVDPIDLPPELADNPDQVFSHPYYWASFTLIGNPW